MCFCIVKIFFIWCFGNKSSSSSSSRTPPSACARARARVSCALLRSHFLILSRVRYRLLTHAHSTHEDVQREAVGFLGNMAALACVDSGRLGAICIENVCYVIKHSENPRVLLLALGALNNLTKACAANREACISHVITMRLVKMLKEGAGKDVLLQLVTLLWNLSLTPSAARALVVSGAHPNHKPCVCWLHLVCVGCVRCGCDDG